MKCVFQQQVGTAEFASKNGGKLYFLCSLIVSNCCHFFALGIIVVYVGK